MEGEREPVWVVFPRIPWGSVGWRMGPGEEYWHAWAKWFRELSAEGQQAYQARWPEPDRWRGFYEYISSGVMPPWFLKRQRQIEQAARSLSPDEYLVDEYFRIVWLLRSELKRVLEPGRHVQWNQLNPEPGESPPEFYTAPDGSVWKLAYLDQGGLRLAKLSGDAILK
ncbi:hypothetical protein EZI54_22365 [Marinobacter halodurans]|uniref:Uncharacterized protein n=1 Tax=Marinobacter halodurans TaxID=2528979 RepID=A0ABY1ZDU7_9GAMM|nr:hypothetical protein EZI54_22365 [Marinobacter halodurans]